MVNDTWFINGECYMRRFMIKYTHKIKLRVSVKHSIPENKNKK